MTQFHCISLSFSHIVNRMIFFGTNSSAISSSRNYDNGSASGTNVASTGDYSHGNPLAHLSESVNAIDPLNAIEKTINEVHTNTHFFLYLYRNGWLGCLCISVRIHIDCNYWHVQCDVRMLVVVGRCFCRRRRRRCVSLVQFDGWVSEFCVDKITTTAAVAALI